MIAAPVRGSREAGGSRPGRLVSHPGTALEGPFALLMLIDGMLCGDEITLARYDERLQRWILLHTGNDFHAVVLRLVRRHP